eukprot:Nitzschia sp. Nitz4//scaffold252_size28738//5120//5725//NITZ4_008093-RA/size28738-processed-gene-0.24-mRNA-1//-1//CDS//3329544257//6886//frame0
MAPHGQRIIVPDRMIQGGMDAKFEADPYDVSLHGILTSTEYTQVIEDVNRRLKPSRSGVVDKALLATGVLMVPLALWGVRHSNQKRRRKRLLQSAIQEFHAQYPHLLMRWNRKPHSCLTIERRPEEQPSAPPPGAPAPPMVPAAVVSNEPLAVHPTSTPMHNTQNRPPVNAAPTTTATPVSSTSWNPPRPTTQQAETLGVV